MTEPFGQKGRVAEGEAAMNAKHERSEAHSHLNLVSDGALSMPAARAPMPALQPTADAAAPQPTNSKLGSGARRKIILGAALTLVLGAAGWYGEHWWTVGRFTVSTDDAYVYAHSTTLAAKVPGYLATIRVADNA